MKLTFLIFILLLCIFFTAMSIRDNWQRSYFVYVSYFWTEGKTNKSGYGWMSCTIITTGYASPEDIHIEIVNRTLNMPKNEGKNINILFYRYDQN